MAKAKKTRNNISGERAVIRGVAIIGFGFLIVALATKIIILLQLEDKQSITFMDYFELAFLILGGFLASFALKLSSKK